MRILSVLLNRLIRVNQIQEGGTRDDTKNARLQDFVIISSVLMIQFSNPGWLFARNAERMRISHERLRNVLHEKSSIFMTMKYKKDMIITKSDKETYEKATHCHICEDEF